MARSKTKNSFSVRWWQFKDLGSFIDIDTHSPEFRWSTEDFRDILLEPAVNAFVVANYLRVAGFLIYEKGKNTFYVLNLGVHPDYQGKGVGKLLLNKIKSKLNNVRNQIRFDVRESNLAGHLFLKSCDFLAKKVLHNYFKDDSESAYSFYFQKQKQPITQVQEITTSGI